MKVLIARIVNKKEKTVGYCLMEQNTLIKKAYSAYQVKELHKTEDVIGFKSRLDEFLVKGKVYTYLKIDKGFKEVPRINELGFVYPEDRDKQVLISKDGFAFESKYYFSDYDGKVTELKSNDVIEKIDNLIGVELNKEKNSVRINKIYRIS